MLLTSNNNFYGTIKTDFDKGPGSREPMEKSTKLQLVLVSGILALALLAYDRIGTVFSTWLSNLVYGGYIPYTFNVSCLVQIFYSIFIVMVPFLLAGLIIKKVQHREPEDKLLPLQPGTNRPWRICSLGIGFGALIVANLVTSIFIQLMEGRGFVVDSYDMELPTTFVGYIMIILADAIVPAFTEEIALRGVVMGSLRKYGDAFAVVFSAMLFGLMHGNMSQAPFSFLLGLVMGYLVLKTGSLWTSIGIHVLNNTYAVILAIIREQCSDQVTAACSAVFAVVGLVLGLIAIAYLVYVYQDDGSVYKLQNPGGSDPAGQRIYRLKAWFYAVISLPMLGALIYLGKALVETIHK